MQIVIRSFGSYRDAIRVRCIAVDVPQGYTPDQVWGTLLYTHPALRSLPRPFAFAVNDEYVASDAAMRDGDELVLVPPLSGGSASGNAMPSPQGGPGA